MAREKRGANGEEQWSPATTISDIRTPNRDQRVTRGSHIGAATEAVASGHTTKKGKKNGF